MASMSDSFHLITLEGKVCLKRIEAADSSAVAVDFSAPALNYRVTSAVKQQGLSKAVGIKAALRPSVLDATAGFGKDAYLLASQGCRVQLFERNPFVFALLQDGLARGVASQQETVVAACQRLSLVNQDFIESNIDALGGVGSVDVVYLDPMFPESKKSARVKKDMFALQELLGAANDAEALWEHACRRARRRVVVKRSKSAPTLGTRAPDIQYKGSSSRFDVYLTPKS